MANGIFEDLFGTLKSYFQIGLGGPRVKNLTGNINLRNAGDSADVALTASLVNVSGDTLVINSDAAETSADWKYTLGRPTSGMLVDQTITLPPTAGTTGQVLSTDGSGNTSWVSAANTAPCLSQHSETVAFGASSPVTLFTLPANAVIYSIDVIVDTAFTGGTSPTLTVGVSGTTSKYVGSGDNDLTTAGRYMVHPSNLPDVSTEALIATYSAGGSSAGSARVITTYSVPAA